MFYLLYTFKYLLKISSLFGIAIGISNNDKRILTAGSVFYALNYLFDFFTYGIDNIELAFIVLIIELGVAIGVGRKMKKMWKSPIILRNEKASDFQEVETLTREAFWNQYVPGCDEHYLLHIMRDKEAFIKELDIVAEYDGKIIGNIVYTKAKILTDNEQFIDVISFGPLSVLPEFQSRGVGGMLIEHTKKLAKELGYKAILIYGEPNYYSKHGFLPAENYKIATSDNMYSPALQAIELFSGALEDADGRFLEDEVYSIDKEAAKEFEKQFTQKELKSGLPTQERFCQLLEMSKPKI